MKPNLVEIGNWIQAGHVSKAADALNFLLNDDPEDAKALWLLGQCEMKQGHYGAAVCLFRRCVGMVPNEPNTWLSFGTALLETHQWDAAEKVFKQTIDMVPKDPVPLANLGALYTQRGRPREAMEWAEKALAISPDYADAKAIVGFSNLYLKRWKEGWAFYDAMIGGKFRKRRVYRIPEEPTWNGEKGLTVVVQGEQGLGDEISFASMLPDIQRDCKKVIVDTDKRLVNLFSRSFPGIDVYGNRRDQDLEWPLQYEIDAHVHIGSLGKHYRLRDKDFPRKPYLIPCPEKRTQWRKWLDLHKGLKVGISWIGGLQHTNRKFRSVTLEDFKPILLPGATYIDLNYRDTFNEVGAWNATNENQILRPVLDKEDYDDTVALIAELDLVISVTTTAIHACGAIGKECWTAVPANPMWRYGVHGDDMVWYPKNSVRLYRQKNGEPDMGHAINRIAEDWSRRLSRKAA